MRLEFNCQNCGTSYSRTDHAAAKGTRFCSSPCRVEVISKEIRVPVAERFWKNVDKRGPDECWPWIGKSTSRGGYGAMHVDGKVLRAPRVSYALEFGEIPSGQVVRHKCDFPSCVNPAHLELGTMKENNDDAIARGRKLPTPPKVTDEQVVEIRNSLLSYAELREIYGVSDGLIGLIRGKSGYRLTSPVTAKRRTELAQSGVHRPRKK